MTLVSTTEYLVKYLKSVNETFNVTFDQNPLMNTLLEIPLTNLRTKEYTDKPMYRQTHGKVLKWNEYDQEMSIIVTVPNMISEFDRMERFRLKIV